MKPDSSILLHPSSLFFALVAALMLGAVARWALTPDAHPDRQARGDMAGLLALTLIGYVGTLARARFEEGSRGFWLCSLALLPFAGVALWLIRRMLGAYRRSRSQADDPKAATNGGKSKP